MERLNKLVCLSLICILLFWTSFPVIASAAFIKPGKPITPGKTYTPGKPITGGQFIVPGDVIQPGTAIKGGKSYETDSMTPSGKPIIQKNPLSNTGIFIIPNAPPTPSNINFIFPDITSGDPITGGAAIQEGKGLNGGKGSQDGKSINGGQTNQNGKGINGGKNTAPGSNIQGGKSNSGNDLNGGNSVEGGKNPSGKNAASGSNISGKGGSDAANNSEPSSPTYSLFIKSANGDRGFMGHVIGAFKDFKSYGLGFVDKFAQGVSSSIAGFNFKKLGDAPYYAVYGKNKLDNKVANWFYQRYKEYNFDGKKTNFGPNARRIGEGRYNEFMKGKNLNGSSFKNIMQSTKKSLNEGFNIFSKDFRKISVAKKFNGPVNLALTAFNSVYDYGFGAKKDKGLASTDFAADLTTDVAIGAGTTAVSTMLSSAASGAMVGSFIPIPGVGTAVGAVVGLGVGALSTYLIYGTPTGRRIKNAARNIVKKGYDGVVSGAKKVGSTISKGAKKFADNFMSGLKHFGGI
ncbi:hypothetical protein [Falsibacillus albus]|uniref:Uncharacterized protein n=1 Tax=Falsibacillus albus TaxID=2478915 RepID=A0A3L7JL22_9BACI|nr:hypothetical protein [Falsibacillus albus]RLQ91160.1 hypothetical protein D9X91_20945 [Falsibacillus albus]